MKIAKEKLVRYTQYHCNEDASKLASIGFTISDEFDGAAEFWARSVEDIVAVFTSQEYLTKTAPDEDNFIDRTKVKLLIGRDTGFNLV